ncbi:MAG: hypothetical protein Q9218_003938 [Villophora microphyllina]
MSGQNKRRAPSDAEQFTEAGLPKRLQATEAMTVSSIPPVAISEAYQPPDNQDSIQVDPLRSSAKEPFLLKKIPAKVEWQRCAFAGVGDDPAHTMGSITEARPDLDVLCQIDAGRAGNPKFMLRVRVSNTPKNKPIQADKPDEYDELTYCWHPGTRNVKDELMIQDYSCQTFDEWFKNTTSYDDRHRPFLNEKQIVELNAKIRQDLFCIRCLLSPAVTIASFQKAESWNNMPAFMRYRLQLLALQSQYMQFWFRTRSPAVKVHIPMFNRRVEDNIGLLSQYTDPTTGQTLLKNMEDVDGIDKVGGGIMINEKDGSHIILPKKDRYVNTAELRDYLALAAIREGQFHQGRYTYLEKQKVEVYPMRIPRFSEKHGEGRTQTQQHRKMDRTFLIYVRCPQSDSDRPVPEPGMDISMRMYDSPADNGSRNEGNSVTIRGTVCARAKSEFHKTDTDFCMFVQKDPWRLTVLYDNLQIVRNLPKAHLKVIFAPQPFNREVTAVHRLCASTRGPVVNFRNMIMNGGEASTGAATKTDLRGGVPHTEKHVTAFQAAVKAGEANGMIRNEGQLEFVNKLGAIENNVLAVVGPPGTGKSSMTAFSIVAMAKNGQQLLVCAPYHVFVDDIAMRVRNFDTGAHGDSLKLLRLQSPRRQRRSTIHSPKKGVEYDPDQSMSEGPISAQDDPDVQMAYRLFTDHASREQLLKFQEVYETYKANYNPMQQHANAACKPSKVPFSMTLDGHIHRIQEEDATNAVEAAKMVHAEAVKADPMAEHELIPANEFNPSYEYTQLYEVFMENEGRLSRQDRQAFFRLRAEMERRVFQEADIVFTTPNSAGAYELEAMGFKPTVILVEEAGQTPLWSLSVPLTAFTTWEALILTGDWKQQPPNVLARDTSEVGPSALVTALERLDTFGINTIHLTEQFRMIKILNQFPSLHFYDGRMTTAESADLDTPERQLIRNILKRKYGVGSELLFLNVDGKSRAVSDGHSLQNPENAAVIADLVSTLFKGGVPANLITLLTYYKAQAQLLHQMIPLQDDGSLMFKEISTVGGFHGKESPVVIVDTTIADYEVLATLPRNKYAWNFESICGRVNRYGKDWHRLCGALTRGMMTLIIIGQAPWLAASYQKGRKDKRSNSLSHLIQDLSKRNLIVYVPAPGSVNQPGANQKQSKNEAVLAALLEWMGKN